MCVYEVLRNRYVLIVSYECEFDDKQELIISDEHTDYGWFNIRELDKYEIADGYKRAIQKLKDA